jgi:hypothetical protein
MMTLKEVIIMKKILALVSVIVLAAVIGLGIVKVTNQAGNPPVGGFTAETVETAQTDFTTDGNPPVGG